ncbi:DUF3329 domain-containing protein [Brucepastera parasyntrophica]|uniref:DUF3329 domain-containing protein n=1 Tax=Brucepastera parasyntrophica TaxID=2880008 RepID=UPI003F72BA88
MNVLTPMIADDYLYSFVYNTDERVSSISDIFYSQYRHYMEWGGRSVAHFLAQLFLFLGKSFFNICNTIVYCIFICLVYFHICGTLADMKLWLLSAIHILLWFSVPVWGQNFLWLTGSCNYLWTTTIILFFLMPFRKKSMDTSYSIHIILSILFLVLGIITGWCNENAGAATLVILTGYSIRKIFKKEKFALFEILGIIGFIIGFYFLLAAPGNYVRMKEFDRHGNMVLHLLKRFFDISKDFFSNGYILAGISVLIGVELLVYEKKG